MPLLIEYLIAIIQNCSRQKTKYEKLRPWSNKYFNSCIILLAQIVKLTSMGVLTCIKLSMHVSVCSITD